LRDDNHRVWSFSTRDTLVTLGVMFAASLVCLPLQRLGESDFHVPLIFLLAVVMISRLTSGYFYGISASILSIFCVNYAFTYPYFAFNFTIAGYPLTFACMLAVSLIICALTSQIKGQERIRIESEKEKMHANLLRAISHDLRTPLTSIIGSTTAVLENKDDLSKEKQIELLADARDDAQWLLRVVENLLSITRIGDKAVDIKREMQAAEEIIAEAAGKFKKQYPDIHVEVSVPEEPLFVPMDAILIEQLIINLLHNAVIHGQHTSVIRVSASKQDDDALFVIADDGAGFSEEMIASFRKNRYAPLWDEKTVDIGRDMGIGLAVCLSIAGAHGGSLTAANDRNGGAVVKLTLPLEEGEA